VVPSFAAASKISSALGAIGNIRADGRPILGLDSQELLKITLTADAESLFIPAHIWTPWFSLFGSKSGFENIEEAFGDLTKYIYAVETGLSSDPYMNWRLSQLDGLTIVSNSDAHSAKKLAREANVMSCAVNYDDIAGGIKTNDSRFVGTIEFFPEEGKYHYDGHRACNIRLTPAETKAVGGICPRCAKPLTIGVENRVETLADRPANFIPHGHKKVEYIIPLVELIAEVKGVSTASKFVGLEFDRVVVALGNEFDVLRTIPIEHIEAAGFDLLAQAIKKMRHGEVVREPGYDGVYGVIKVNVNKNAAQLTLGL